MLSSNTEVLSLGRFLALLIEPYKDVFRTSSGHWWDTSLGVTYQTVWGRPHNLCKRRHRDVGRGRPMASHIGQYGDVLRTSYFNVLRKLVEDVLRTSVGDVPQRYIEDRWGRPYGDVHMGTYIGTSFGDVFSTSLGRNLAEWVGGNSSEHHGQRLSKLFGSIILLTGRAQMQNTQTAKPVTRIGI